MSTLKVSTISPLGTDATKTITLGESGGTLGIASGAKTSGFGKIGQIVEGSSSTNYTNSSTSMSEMLNASITPSSTTSKILIHFHANCQVVAGSNAYGRATVFRGTTSGTDLGALIGGDAAASNANFPLTGTYIDSPSTTSAQQYTLAMSTASGSTTSVTTDSTTYRLVLMEILD
jgi:hypothetical protein